MIDEIVEAQLAETEAKAVDGVVDLAQTFAFPVPFRVICDLLGLRDEDREHFRNWRLPVLTSPKAAAEPSARSVDPGSSSLLRPLANAMIPARA
ncbi:MAG: hypothetical protein R2709_12225 [Marmoricola sp.]